jgi:hypothetical protein
LSGYEFLHHYRIVGQPVIPSKIFFKVKIHIRNVLPACLIALALVSSIVRLSGGVNSMNQPLKSIKDFVGFVRFAFFSII